MALDKDWIERLRRTWALAAADADRTSMTFYGTLFRLDPSTKPLFVNNLDLQGRKLAQTLSFIVDHLDDLETLIPAAEALAKRHVDYNVHQEHYASVGAALVQTLQDLLGSEFSNEDALAWQETYAVLSGVMIKSAYPE